MDLRSAGEPRARVAATGSSAGGLEALRSILAHLPAPGPHAYVVAQRLSPRHASMLRILSAAAIRAARTYVTPPNANILSEDGKLVPRTSAEHGSEPSVDLLFQSAAREYGSRGVRAVKRAGGNVIAQTPATAKLAGMPEAIRPRLTRARATGCAR